MKSFMVIGDTHGNFLMIRRHIKKIDLTDTIIFHVGDFGLGFDGEDRDRNEIEMMNRLLIKRNCMMYVCRGNHDNPYMYDGSWSMSNIKLGPDYTVVELDDDNKVLMVGGAISIDRGERKARTLASARKGKFYEDYWYDEGFVLDPKKVKDLTGITYVITHSAPSFCDPLNKIDPVEAGFIGDTNLVRDLKEEREDLTKLYNLVDENNSIKKWFYGHFHRHSVTAHDATDFIMLAIDEVYEERG